MRSRNVIYNVISNLILQIIIIVYGFVVPKIIISNYGSNVNGLVSSITQFLAYISLLDSGFTAVVKSQLYKPIVKKDKRSINSILKAADIFFKRIAYIFIAYIVFLAFFYPILVNGSFDYWSTFLLVIILSISSFAEYYFGMVFKIFLQTDQKSYIISIIQIVMYILIILATIILSKYNISIHMLKLFTGFIFVLRPIVQNLYVKRKYNININSGDGDYKIKNKWDGLAQHIASVIHNNTDITILTFCGALRNVSVYSVYSMVVRGVKSLMQAFSNGIDSTFGNMLASNEINNLRMKFNIYETLYNMVSSILFTCTIILIVPFVSIYTNGIKDANYIRHTFGLLIVISEYIWSIRQPYNELIKAAGHFKETRIGAWIECITNIIISVLLVRKYGLVGVAIGTIFAMSIRTIEFIYHANKYIIKRSIWISLKKIMLLVIGTVIIVVTVNCFTKFKYNSYIDWITNSIVVFALSSIIILTLNSIFYRNDIQLLFYKFKEIKNKKESDLSERF